MGLIPGLTQWVKDLALLHLWCRLAAAALVQPPAWESPYAAGEALKKKKKKKEKKEEVLTVTEISIGNCGEIQPVWERGRG